MIKDGLLDKPVFSFCHGASKDDGGEVIIGGIDDKAYSDKLIYTPVRQKAYREVDLNKVTWGGDTIELENTGAAIDTSTADIIMPVDIADIVNTMIEARRERDGTYTVDCTNVANLPDLVFFDGVAYPIKGTDYIISLQRKCVSPFTGVNLPSPCGSGSFWRIGHVFLRKYYIMFDMEKHRVGFALAK